MADEQEPESEMVKKLRERAAKPLSRVQRRLIEPFSEEDHPLCFQHSVFCQVSLPYRNPGDDNRLWQRRQGNTFLEIEASRVFHPGSKLPCRSDCRGDRSRA
jgi:hypothetical protein